MGSDGDDDDDDDDNNNDNDDDDNNNDDNKTTTVSLVNMIFIIRYIVFLNICLFMQIDIQIYVGIHKMYISYFFYKVIYKLYDNSSYKFRNFCV